MKALAEPSAVPGQPPDGTQAARRWFATGRSVDVDPRVAGATAADTALAGRSAALVMIFCPSTLDLVAVVEGVRAAAGDVPLIGCTGQSQYTGDGPVEPAVVVSALGGDGFEIHTDVAMNVSAGQRAAGEQVAEVARTLTRKHKVLLLLCDGLAGEQHELVRGAYSVVGATIPLVGGCASDDLSYARTSQFFADDDGVHVLTDAVVAAAIGSDAPMGIGVSHGWRKVGTPMLVTDSSDGRVRTLNGQPALDVFLNQVGADRATLDDHEKFLGLAMRHPFGMSRRSGEDIRVIHDGNVADGSISCLADVPQGALLWQMEADRAGLIAAVDDAHAQAIASLDGVAPLGFLSFDCGARLLILDEDGARAELEQLVQVAEGVPFAGFYTFGEFARIRGARGMHHLTLVLLAFG